MSSCIIRNRRCASCSRWMNGMKRLLSWLAQRILSGAIECEPDEDACTYCDFHDICRYHGQPYVREAIITREGTYAEGKEEQHAEVE